MNKKDLLVYYLSGELKQVGISVALLLAIGVVMLIFYVNISSSVSIDAIRNEIVPDSLSSQSTIEIFEDYITGLRNILLSGLRYTGYLALVFLIIVYLAQSLLTVTWEFISSVLILQRNEQTWDYLEDVKNFERKYYFPVIATAVLSLLLMLLIGWNSVGNPSGSISDSNAHSLAVILVVFIITVLFVEYYAKLRFGFFSNINTRFPNRLTYYRILLSRLLILIFLFLFLYGALSSVQYTIVPLYEDKLTKDTATLSIKNQEFQEQALSAGYDFIDIDQFIQNGEQFVEDRRLSKNEMMSNWLTGTSGIYWALGIFLVVTLVTHILFPILHTEIRFVPFAVALVFIIFIGITLIIRYLAPILLSSDNQATTGIIFAVGLSLVIGELVFAFIKHVFKKPLDIQSTYSLLGNEKTKRIHRSKCPFISRTKKQNLIEFDNVDSGVKLGYVACNYCLVDAKT